MVWYGMANRSRARGWDTWGAFRLHRDVTRHPRERRKIKQLRPYQLVPHLTNLYILRRMRQVSSMLKGELICSEWHCRVSKVHGKVLYIGIMVEVLVSAIFKFIVRE